MNKKIKTSHNIVKGETKWQKKQSLALKRQKVSKTASKLKNSTISEFDTLGSYTGVVLDNKYEMPTQDADDL